MSLFRFTRTSQPQQPVPIDWNNPITRGLTVANYGNSRINLVDGKSEIANTSLASGVSAAGVSGQALVNSTARYWKTPVVGSNGSTIFGAGKAQSVASATLYGSYCQDGTNAGYINVIEASNYSVLSLPTYAGRSTPRPSDGTNFNHATVATSTSSDAWLNGKKYGTGLGGSYGNLSVAGYVEYTGSTAQPRPTNGLLFLAWGRALSDLEIKSLSDNPWQIFLPTNRAIYPAAAGSTYTLTADAASYSITGADASLIVNRKLIADTANIPIAGADATLTYTPIGGPTYTLTADAGSYAITGNATGLAFNRVLTADAGSCSVSGQAVGLAFNRVLSAATANIPVAGQDVTLTYTNNGFTYTLSAEAGAFSVTGQDARLVWSGEQTGFTNEVVLKPWYIRRNKKILLFSTAQEADAYIEAEEVAEQAIQEAQKTSRRARKRLRDKLITIEPIQTVDVDQLAEAVQRFSIPVDLPKLIAQQDYERVMQIIALAADMQDEEDVEMLLLM